MTLLVILFAGCASDGDVRQVIDPGTTSLVVERLEFRGVENVSESALRDGLALREDPGWRGGRIAQRIPVLGQPPAFYNQFHWRRDRERILAYYRSQGYYNASIVSESIIEDHDAGTVRIRVTIEEGEPTRINRLDIQGLVDGVTPTQTELLRDLPLRTGEIFVEADYLATRTALGARLREAGHAYAVVNGRVFVDPQALQADVYFFADAGPPSTLGSVYIFGLENVREEQVRAAIPFQRGDSYSPGTLQETQNALYDLGVFGLVSVLPAHEARGFNLEDPEEREQLGEILEEFDVPADREPDVVPDTDLLLPPPDEADDAPLGISRLLGTAQRRAESRTRLQPEVPIVIRIQEARPYSVRVGAGIAAETARQDTRALLHWSARNFLGGLRRLEHFNAVGYAWSPTIFTDRDERNQGIILSSELNFQQPQFIDRRTNLRLRAAVERDVRQEFSVWNPSFRISLDRPFWDRLVISVSYNLAYFNYFNIAPGLDETATQLGVDFREEFLLEYLEQSITLDYRSDVLNPRRGFMLSLAVQESGRYIFGGEFDFIKPVLSAEGYVPFTLVTPAVLALRSRLGSAYNIGRPTGVPVQSRLYSGGTDGMRSFGRRRLSLYTATGEPAVPIGGLTLFEAAVEPRFRLVRQLLDIGDLWGALFVDAATVLGGQLFFDTETNQRGVVGLDDIGNSLLYGLGAGLWWNTPVGPVRLDFAYTLSSITDDIRFRRCTNIDDYATPECEFLFEDPDDDPIQQLIQGYGLYLSIGHSF